MSRVRSKDTSPELRVRIALTAEGVRYRLHRHDLPGTPDVYVPRIRLAIFVNGCFWHGHACPRGRGAKSNAAFWDAKIAANRERDARAVEALSRSGIATLTLWECAISSSQAIAREISDKYRFAKASIDS